MQFIYEILRQIVIDVPPSLGCERVNTFFVLTNGHDWEGEAFGKTWQDYLNKHYWTRKRVSKNDISGGYGALAIERAVSTTEGDSIEEDCENFIITIGQVAQCSNCPKNCNRTKIEVDESNRRVLKEIVKEFLTYAYYGNIENIASSEVTEGWLSEGRAEYLRANGYRVNGMCNTLEGNTYFDNLGVVQYNLSDFETSSEVQTMSVSMKVCGCGKDETEYFKYNNSGDPNNETGVVVCDTCLK